MTIGEIYRCVFYNRTSGEMQTKTYELTKEKERWYVFEELGNGNEKFIVLKTQFPEHFFVNDKISYGYVFARIQ